MFFVDSCATKLSCQNGGYTDPKNCSTCRCPDSWDGVLCDRTARGSTGAINNNYSLYGYKYLLKINHAFQKYS